MRRPRIWVVEDDDANFELVEYLLVDGGCDIERARDAAELERLARGAPPDLVLLDITLPGGGSGLELLARMRRSLTAVPPVVALTAHAMSGDRERFLAAGCDGYIAKPIDPTRFVGQVRAYLQGSDG